MADPHFLIGQGLSEQALKREYGVYSTPQALSRFMVRMVDELLADLGLRGLHDPAVRLLDPAAGPMNFLLDSYRRATARHRQEQGRKGIEDLVRRHLALNFQGIEILPGSWSEGVRRARSFFQPLGFASRLDPPLPVFLADALAGPDHRPAGARCVHEAGVNVVLGNPPFGRGPDRDRNWINSRVRSYFTMRGEPLGEQNLKWLSDDYVRFLRLGQDLIERNGWGILGFVLNHNCLDGTTFRGLRSSLLESFDLIYALDLHGNARKREKSPSGGLDENVFEGVAQGIAVLFLVKGTKHRRIYRGDLYGSRAVKMKTLAGASRESLPWREIRPRGPAFLLRDSGTEREYERGVPLPEIFPVSSLGVVTGNDAEMIALRREDFEGRLVAEGREELRRTVRPLLFRPFDLRQILYEGSLLARPRRRVMAHLLEGRSVALLAPRQSGGAPGVFVTRWPSGHKVVDRYSPNTVFPLQLSGPAGAAEWNLQPLFLENLAAVTEQFPSARNVFGYVYAILNDHRFLSRYREQLREGFPRIPLPCSPDRFRQLAALGRELAGLHLLEDPRLAASGLPVEVHPQGGQKARVAYDKAAGAVILGKLAVLGVPPEVWAYQVGSYRVLNSWLRARGNGLTEFATLRELRSIVDAVRLSIAVHERIQAT